MHRCLELAALGMGKVAPNPMVGAVLVHNDRIIGEGYHERYGEAHAEVNCLENVVAEAKDLVKDATLYVSLEPCTHFGKTPPCTDLIISTGIRHVVIGCQDSFEKVNGSGIQKLKDAGIRVDTGILEKEAIDLNKRFFTFHKKQRPYIILKWAQTNNGIIANADLSPLKISNSITDMLVHRWRSEESAIMVGSRTAWYDNPSLTTRLYPGNNPVRLVIDKQLKLPATHHLLDGQVPTIVLNTIRQQEDGNTSFYKTGESEDMLAVTLSILRQRNLLSLIVEGGKQLIQSFINTGCWDEARVITNTKMVVGEGVSSPRLNLLPYKKENIRDDEVQYFRNSN